MMRALFATLLMFSGCLSGQTSIRAGSGTVVSAIPAYAAVFNVQALPSTDFTSQGGACCGTGTDGSINVTFGNASPSLSGSSIMLSTTGESYNGQVFTQLCSSFASGSCADVTDVFVDDYVYIPSSSSVLQGMEGPNAVFYTGTTEMYPSTQCATNSESTTPSVPTWNVWSGTAWVSLNISCAEFLTGTNTWHHLQAHYSVNISAGTFTYDRLVVDGVAIYSSGATYSGISDVTSAAMKAQHQVDATSTATSSTYYIDNWTVSVW